MSTQTFSVATTGDDSGLNLRAWIGRMWAFNWPLTLSVLIYVALIPLYIIAALTDPRTITGAPAFIKPLKFILSSAIYLVTFLWLLSLVKGRRRLVAVLAGVTALGLLVENVIITLQALRGTLSHYNIATDFDSTLFSLMGIFVTLIAFMNLGLGILLLFQRLPDRATAWAVRLGVLIAFVGMMTGFLMTSLPSPTQRAQMDAGVQPTAFGAHSVGVEDGGPGLPFVGWSTAGGDLRVAHFFGLHAMQVLPLLALALTMPALRRRMRPAQRTAVVVIGGVAYLGWVLLLTWQALRGQPFLAPDLATLTAYALLLGSTAGALTIALWPRAGAPTPVAGSLG